ncbi:CysS/YqeB C-terminal domain-containing protein [Streptomyces deserti]
MRQSRASCHPDLRPAEDARELRRELLRLGVVVRDEGKRQYWRVVQRS